jgi:hypothetical protein
MSWKTPATLTLRNAPQWKAADDFLAWHCAFTRDGRTCSRATTVQVVVNRKGIPLCDEHRFGMVGRQKAAGKPLRRRDA